MPPVEQAATTPITIGWMLEYLFLTTPDLQTVSEPFFPPSTGFASGAWPHGGPSELRELGV